MIWNRNWVQLLEFGIRISWSYGVKLVQGRWTMSQINFASLIDEVPELTQAWEKLRQWFERHPRIKFVDLGRLAKEVPEVESVALVLAMKAMVERDLLKPVFRFRDPEGHLGDQDFPAPTA